jgi:hypothetical protein
MNMAKVISIQQYVEELNNLLKEQDWYKPGMEVRLHPGTGHPAEATGLDTVNMEPGQLPQLRKQLEGKFEVDVPPHA